MLMSALPPLSGTWPQPPAEPPAEEPCQEAGMLANQAGDGRFRLTVLANRKYGGMLDHLGPSEQSAHHELGHGAEAIGLYLECPDEVGPVDPEQAGVRVHVPAEDHVVETREIMTQDETVARHIVNSSVGVIRRGHHH